MSTSKPTPLPQERSTQEIEPDQWITFLAKFTRDYRGAHARLDVLGGEVRYQVETENKPFDGIAADVKDDAKTVWITFGATPADHLNHGIHHPRVIRVLPETDKLGPVLEVEAQDGTTTVLELSRPEAYALPGKVARQPKAKVK
jgi:hypothetical protein